MAYECSGGGGGGGGSDLERGYGDVRLWRPPFQASSAVRKGPISSKRVSSQDPFWENLEILASTASIFAQILALKPPNLKMFSSPAPQIGNFQFTSPPFQRQISVRKPHTLEIRAAHPYLKKKVEFPPPHECLRVLRKYEPKLLWCTSISCLKYTFNFFKICTEILLFCWDTIIGFNT